MKLLIWLRAGCITLVVLFFAFIGFWTWARDDFFPKELTLSAPPQGVNRVAAVADFDLQGDGYHILGVKVHGKWQRWAEIGTQSEFSDWKWRIVWSRDGSLVALQQSGAMLGQPELKKYLSTHVFDFKTAKKHESSHSLEEMPHSPFSHRIDEMMKGRGGAVAGRETRRDVGVWRWQDADWKRFFEAK